MEQIRKERKRRAKSCPWSSDANALELIWFAKCHFVSWTAFIWVCRLKLVVRRWSTCVDSCHSFGTSPGSNWHRLQEVTTCLLCNSSYISRVLPIQFWLTNLMLKVNWIRVEQCSTNLILCFIESAKVENLWTFTASIVIENESLVELTHAWRLWAHSFCCIFNWTTHLKLSNLKDS